MQEFKTVRKLLDCINLYHWVIPAAISLGFFASLAEGFSISLFVPFLQSLDNSSAIAAGDNSYLMNSLSRLFATVPDAYRIYAISGSILASVVMKNILTYGNTALSAWLYMQIYHNLVCQAYGRLLTINLNFLDSKDPGKILNTLNTQTWRACEAITSFIMYVTSVCTIIVFLGLLLLTSFKLTVYVIILLTIVSFIIIQLNHRIRQLGRKAVQTNDLLSKRMVEGLQGMRLIRAFNQEDFEQERLTQASAQNRNVHTQLEFLGAIPGPLSEIFSVILILAILIAGVLYNLATLPVLLTFIVILYSLQPKIKQLDSNRAYLVGLTGAVEDVISLLQESDVEIVSKGRIPFKSLQQSICFKSVSFSYQSSNTHSLKQVSISFPKNQTTAIVGPSGAGKSTIIGLIIRFYDATKGEIYVDGYPLKEFDLATWRSQIGVVSQETFLFSASIGENIAYGSLNATEAEIVEAAKKSFAHEFICRLPQGYNTPVGERGVRLSGGQRQRLALARAIVRNPEILILDEATNALDSQSEHLIQEALRTISRHRTVIVVAHRLSTIREADNILVMQEGELVEQGGFRELLEKNGLFSRLYNLQHRQIV